jgi:hypothetical protein
MEKVTTQFVRRGGLVAEVVIGDPLPQKLIVPKKYQAAVTKLVDHPAAKETTTDIGRYLRYYLVVHPRSWSLAIGEAESILDGEYPWDSYGFAGDDEGNNEGPDCLIMDYDWDLVDPRGEPTLDPKANCEAWVEDFAFDDVGPTRRRRDMEILVTVLARGKESLLKELTRADIGWNLKQVLPTRSKRRLELTHEFFSGRSELTEPEPGVLICRILATDRYDPERLLAMVIGALHRRLQQKVHSMTVQYVEEATTRGTRK